MMTNCYKNRLIC